MLFQSKIFNLKSQIPLLGFLLTAGIGFGLDLWTKALAFSRLAPYGLRETFDGRIQVRVEDLSAQEYQLLPRWLHFRAMANQGAVFGIGQGHRVLFLIVSLLAIAFIVYLFATSGRARFYQFILGLLLAGVLGNMYDRLMYGYVRDMIYIFPHRLLWGGSGREVFPWIFNVADSMLCVGVFLIAMYLVFGTQAPQAATRESTDDVPEAGTPRSVH